MPYIRLGWKGKCPIVNIRGLASTANKPKTDLLVGKEIKEKRCDWESKTPTTWNETHLSRGYGHAGALREVC